MKRIASIAVLLAVIAVIWYVVAHAHHDVPQAAAAPDVHVTRAVTGDFAVRITAQGRVGAPAGSASSLTFAVPGILRTVHVRVGERVASGQPLAELDSAQYVNAVDQAQGDALASSASYGGGSVPGAAFQSARARLESAATQADLRVAADRRALERQRTLFGAGITAAKDVEAAQALLAADEAQATADHQQARSDVRSAQAQFDVLRGQAQRAAASLAQARRELAAAMLRAPADGVVMAILKHPGESVDATVPVIVIGPSSDATASLFLPGADARGVKVGDRVDLSLARSNESARGAVVAVVPAVDPNTQESTVVVSGVPRDAVPGDALRATITVSVVRAVIVPLAAVVQDPQSGDAFVFVRKTSADGSASYEARKVVVRASDGASAAIAKGLRDGETVASKGAFELMSAPSSGGG